MNSDETSKALNPIFHEPGTHPFLSKSIGSLKRTNHCLFTEKLYI
ncbi:MAG: hypothetical protein K0R26_1194 [Bacteroidota bacterium]|jgi:hypothetical protein|nr:hypothetical protein [Bacteroidota bacterium]